MPMKSVLLAIVLCGCGASVSTKIDQVCSYVALTDEAIGAAITEGPAAGVPDAFIDGYLVPIARVVVEAHDFCFEDSAE